MHSLYQRFLATILLFSLLLQSCGHPNCTMVEANEPRICTRTNSIQASPDSTSSRFSSTFQHAEKQGAEKAVSTSHGTPLDRVIYYEGRSNQRSLSSSNAIVPTPRRQVSRSPNPAIAVKPSGSTQRVGIQHTTKKLRYKALGKASVSSLTSHRDKQARATPLPASVGFAECSAQRSHSLQRVAHQPQTESKPIPRNAAYPDASSIAPRHASTPFYPSAQGHQVHFQAEAGKWQAQVEDVWGRVQRLPVVCAPDQTPARAIEQLANKARGQHKYWVHLLETNQPPWAPRCVYVGALGLRGGMPKPDYHVSVAENSDSDSDQVINRTTTNGIQVSFRPASDGDWHASTSWHPSSRRIWVMSDYRLSLSANDIRNANWTLWHNRAFCTDHVEIHSTPSTISSRKSERRARRYERHQERIRSEQRREQERLDALIREEEQRSRARLETIRAEEARITQELVRIGEEEQASQESRNRQREALYARQAALHQEQDVLRRDAIENERSYQHDVEALEQRTREAEAALLQQRVIDEEKDRQRQARAEEAIRKKKDFGATYGVALRR